MSLMRWCMPWVRARGEGLGNEMVPWARAYLMALNKMKQFAVF